MLILYIKNQADDSFSFFIFESKDSETDCTERQKNKHRADSKGQGTRSPLRVSPADNGQVRA